jgi:predicted 3-demethylubiquinone-9 3-methyltransferase (glyoxalase superfamily)
MHLQKITPCLWFNGQAEEAANFYVSIFNNSKILNIAHYSKAGPGSAGSVMTVSFQLDGQEFLALNGGPLFQFTEATSFIVYCETQDEVDTFWEKLSAGGEEVQCGWLKDKYGLSWQIVPTVLSELMSQSAPEKSQKVMSALLQMRKLNIETLLKAALS